MAVKLFQALEIRHVLMGIDEFRLARFFSMEKLHLNVMF